MHLNRRSVIGTLCVWLRYELETIVVIVHVQSMRNVEHVQLIQLSLTDSKVCGTSRL